MKQCPLVVYTTYIPRVYNRMVLPVSYQRADCLLIQTGHVLTPPEPECMYVSNGVTVLVARYHSGACTQQPASIQNRITVDAVRVLKQTCTVSPIHS